MTLIFDNELFEKMQLLPTVPLQKLIYHYYLLILIRCENKRIVANRLLKMHYRTFIQKLGEIKALNYPVPETRKRGNSTNETRPRNDRKKRIKRRKKLPKYILARRRLRCCDRYGQ
jgi:ABC-type oligopeptide transport system ATPase subunit